jgi:transposase
VEEKKDQKKRRKYDADFKKEVMEMIYHGRSVHDISQSLGVSENLIYRWKSHSVSPVVPLKPSDIPEMVPYAEHEKLKSRLKQTEQERDILKKALGIFSRGD